MNKLVRVATRRSATRERTAPCVASKDHANFRSLRDFFSPAALTFVRSTIWTATAHVCRGGPLALFFWAEIPGLPAPVRLTAHTCRKAHSAGGSAVMRYELRLERGLNFSVRMGPNWGEGIAASSAVLSSN